MTTKAEGEAKDVAPVKYVATDVIRFGIHAGYQEGDPVSEQVVQDNDLVNRGLVKKV